MATFPTTCSFIKNSANVHGLFLQAVLLRHNECYFLLLWHVINPPNNYELISVKL